jgi:hypothetical protein
LQLHYGHFKFFFQLVKHGGEHNTTCYRPLLKDSLRNFAEDHRVANQGYTAEFG